MFISEWREFSSALCLAGKKPDNSSRPDVVEIARFPFFLVGLRTYHHPIKHGFVFSIIHYHALTL